MATQKQVFTEITESIDRCNHTLPGLIQFLKNGFKKLENASGGGGGGSTVEWTQIQATGTKIAEIEIDGDKTSVYAPTGATPTISVNAEDVAYNNTVSGLTADNCQEAIDELKSLIPGASGSVSVTADGVKTYSQLLNELNALIDFSKVNRNTTLTDSGDKTIAHIGYKDASRLDFVSGIANHRYSYSVRSSASVASSYAYASNTYTDRSANAPTSGIEFKIEY